MHDDCGTCGEGCGTPNECPGSLRECGHHCNHIRDEDACCWCPARIDDDGNLVGADGVVIEESRDD